VRLSIILKICNTIGMPVSEDCKPIKKLTHGLRLSMIKR